MNWLSNNYILKFIKNLIRGELENHPNIHHIYSSPFIHSSIIYNLFTLQCYYCRSYNYLIVPNDRYYLLSFLKGQGSKQAKLTILRPYFCLSILMYHIVNNELVSKVLNHLTIKWLIFSFQCMSETFITGQIQYFLSIIKKWFWISCIRPNQPKNLKTDAIILIKMIFLIQESVLFSFNQLYYLWNPKL